ncbi:MAG TPA: hypothetical protein VIS57_04930 [Xanthomonadales bacterium]
MTANKIQRKPLNWLLLEGAAIVISILLAFWINAWWQNHNDQLRERQYLVQLRSDTLENKHRLDEALQLERAQQGVVSAILASIRDPAPMAPEAARAWAQVKPEFMWYSDPRLLDGTFTALIATGDINLIHDERVKTALITYHGELEADLDQFRISVNQFLNHHDDLLRIFEAARAPGIDHDGDELANQFLSIQNDKNAAAIFRLIEKNIANRAWYLEQMRLATETLIGQLDMQSDL